jgi:hypothetical protein
MVLEGKGINCWLERGVWMRKELIVVLKELIPEVKGINCWLERRVWN